MWYIKEESYIGFYSEILEKYHAELSEQWDFQALSEAKLSVLDTYTYEDAPL